MGHRPVKFAVFNNKGGVGKSTLSVHIAHGLALNGYKVLLLDADGQNDAGLFLGIGDEDYNKTLYDVICGTRKVDLKECIIRARDNLDLLPSARVDLINMELYRQPGSILHEKLEPLAELGYEVVIIDCGPQRTKVNDAILYYADGLIVPVQVQAASLRAIGNIYEYLFDLRLHTELIKLIVPMMFDRRLSDARENLELLKEFCADDDLLAPPVHRRTRIAEAGKFGMTAYEYDGESARQFDSIVKRVIAHVPREVKPA
jgi:chromosome partitioning protein